MIETAVERPLQILHVHVAEESRGGDYQTLALMEALARLGHKQTLLAPVGSPLGSEACSRGLDVLPLSLPSIVRLSAYYDLVHAHDTRAHSMAAATARVPVIAARRVAPIRRGPGFRWKYRRTAHFIAVSHYVERLLLEAGIAPERISVVYDGVDVGTVRESDASLVLAVEPNPVLESAGTSIHFSTDLAADLPSARVFLYIVDEETSVFPVLRQWRMAFP